MATVLVVEGNRMIRTMYAAGLAGYGYKVMEAHDAHEARTHLQTGVKPRVVLLNLNLPDDASADLISHIRAQAGNQDIKIIASTSNHAARDAASRLGADMLLPKPVELVDLLNTVKACEQ